MASDSSTQHNSNANENQSGPLPRGWEVRTDRRGRTYYVDHNTRSTTWDRPSRAQEDETNMAGSGGLPAGWEERYTVRVRAYFVDHNTRSTTWVHPSSNQAVDHQAQEGETNMADSGSLPAGWEERRAPDGQLYYVNHITGHATRVRPSSNQAVDNQAHGSGSLPAGWEERTKAPDGRLYYVDHNTQTTLWVDPRRQITTRVMGPNGQSFLLSQTLAQSISQLGPLPSRWDIRFEPSGRFYFIDHNTRITTWNDPRLSSLDESAPQYLRDFSQKLIYFRSRPAMCFQLGDCEIKIRRDDLLADSYAEIMRQTPNDLKRRLNIKFKGKVGLEYEVPARFVS
jgi:E3 ubiquitin-protein ligase NEDD4